MLLRYLNLNLYWMLNLEYFSNSVSFSLHPHTLLPRIFSNLIDKYNRIFENVFLILLSKCIHLIKCQYRILRYFLYHLERELMVKILEYS